MFLGCGGLLWCSLAGILLLLYALFRDRPGLLGTPRERCTRCRYDMTGTAGPTDDQPEITCPECGLMYTEGEPNDEAGHRAHHERALRGAPMRECESESECGCERVRLSMVRANI